jgi:retinol-binding protein 3
MNHRAGIRFDWRGYGRSVTTVLAVAALAMTADGVRGQQRQGGAPTTVDGPMRTAVIDGAIEHMRRAYIFADVAERMAEAIGARAAKKEYDGITLPREFAETLTRHLQEVSRDKHLRIVYDPEGLPQRGGAPTPEERARGLADERRRNFGFERIERLDGNIGLIELRAFSGTPEARAPAVAAMNLLADTDALIFDLRRNGGGSPFMIGILSSYLFEEVVHLNDFYVRETDSRREFFTTADVEGRRYGKAKPVYVLTSSRTFSAAEEFTYNLKNLGRATIVGETTGGGAHPGGVRRITDHFGIWLPTGRAINPITKTNWEGTGIEPHLSVASTEALRTAHLAAVKKVRATATDPRHAAQLDTVIAALEKPAGR